MTTLATVLTRATLVRPTILPSELAGLAGWYAADLSTKWQDSARTTPVTADGDPVGAWDDLSGNGNHFTQSTGAQRPAYRTAQINGRAVLDLDGTGDVMYANGLSSVYSGTDVASSAFVAFRKVSNTTHDEVYGASRSSASNPLHLIVSNDNAGLYRFLRRDDAGSTGNVNGSTATLVATVHSNVYTGTTASTWIDGADTAILDDSADVGATTIDRVTIGAINLGGPEVSYADVEIAELVVYNRALSTGERRAIERYLGTKYGVTMT